MSDLIFHYPEQAKEVNINKNEFSFKKFNEKTLTKGNKVVKNNIFEKDIIKTIKNIVDSGVNNGHNIIESYRKNYDATYDCYHGGYLEYLHCAYVQDLGIEIAPWYLWNVIFHQVCQIIKTDEERFRHIFTNSKEKIILTFFQDEIDIGQYTNEIKKLIPNEENYNIFFPSWSNTPNFYNESMQGLFADMVQNYYGCLIMECSLPAVKILGTQDDWSNLNNYVTRLNDLLHIDYLLKVSKYTKYLSTEWSKKDTWKHFFEITHCGSGHQACLVGDFRKLLNYSEMSELLTSQLQNTMSKFPFTNKNNYVEISKDEFMLCDNCFFNAGIVGSTIQEIDGIHFLIPHYDYSITFIDKRKLNVSEDEKLKYIDLINKLGKLNRLNGTSIKNHFTYKQSSFAPKEHFNFNQLLSDEEVKILAIENNDIKIKKLNIHLNVLLERHNNRALHYQNSNFEFSDDRKKIKTFDEIKKDFDNRLKNGQPYQYMEKMEESRIDKLKDTYNIWFKGKDKIIGDKKYPFGSLKNLTLTYSDYIANKDEAFEYYNFLLNYDDFMNFYDSIKTISNNYQLEYDLTEVVLFTFDIEIYKNYENIIKNNKQLHKNFIVKIANLCGINAIQENYIKIINLDNELKKELLDKFNDVFLNDFKYYVRKEYENLMERLDSYRKSNYSTKIHELTIDTFCKRCKDYLTDDNIVDINTITLAPSNEV
jgi:hypothetical protein